MAIASRRAGDKKSVLSLGAVCSCRCSRCAVRGVRCCSGLRIIDPMLRHRCFKTIQFCLKNSIEATLPRHLLGIKAFLRLPENCGSDAVNPASLPHSSRPRHPRWEFRLRSPTKVGVPTVCQRHGSREIADRVALPSILLPTQDCSTQSCLQHRIAHSITGLLQYLPKNSLKGSGQQLRVSKRAVGALS